MRARVDRPAALGRADPGRGVGRGGVVLLVVVVALGLLIGADRVTHAYGQRAVAARMQTSLATAHRPGVRIAGFSFLNQVVAGDYHQITVHAGAVPAQGVDWVALDELDVVLSDVETADGFAEVTAGRLDGTAVIGYPALSRRAGQGFVLGYGGQDPTGRGRVTATRTASVYGAELTVKATGGLSLDVAAQTVTIVQPTLQVLGLTLPSSLVQALAGPFLRPVPVGELPLGVTLDGVQPTAAGLTASVSGTDVRISG